MLETVGAGPQCREDCVSHLLRKKFSAFQGCGSWGDLTKPLHSLLSKHGEPQKMVLIMSIDTGPLHLINSNSVQNQVSNSNDAESSWLVKPLPTPILTWEIFTMSTQIIFYELPVRNDDIQYAISGMVRQLLSSG